MITTSCGFLSQLYVSINASSEIPFATFQSATHHMLLFLISCLSFIFLSKLLSLKPLHTWTIEKMSLCTSSMSMMKKKTKFTEVCLLGSSTNMPKKERRKRFEVEVEEETEEMCLLDLPDLVLESILEKLPPSGLCRMAGVCRSLRDRCRSNYLWERYMKEKWGSVIGDAAYREWQWHIASSSTTSSSSFKGKKKARFARSLSRILCFARAGLMLDNDRRKNLCSLSDNSIMSWYAALESGNFWFPAQVYNRENGHVGFMLSCYDADVSYDSQTDSFHARYPPHGRRPAVIEEGVQWDRLRKPPVDTFAHYLHISNCLNELRPGNHIEIQWRRNKEFPYGWWYGVIGHLEMCDKIDYHCQCHNSDTVVLEFNQYTPGSRWTRATINRKNHREEGNEMEGFYGGIRKLDSNQEITTWKRLWPAEALA
ncbi:hypothetical protein Sjap_001877 [Stephania japonica]|uniref:F-box domain-containing protein n=1 Tax=Stephania japonica TaxID=461633 RepID=A0AAP0KN32_9MAGN